MTEHDTDFEFDFFEDEPREPPPSEEGTRVRRPGGPPPRRPTRGPTGVTPLFRLAGLIAFAILIIVLFVFWVQSCQSSGKRNAYENYMTKVADIAKDSEQIGRELTDALTTPGIKPADLDAKLAGLAQQQQQDVAKALALSPPGPLRAEQLSVVEALNFRVSGLQGLAATFRRSAGTKDVAGEGILLAQQAQRLVTSDIVWDDLFKGRSIAEMQHQGVAGVAVPDSNFSQNPDFGSTTYWVPIAQRLQSVSGGGTNTTGGGLHGTALVSVTALPSNKALDPNVAENTVTATTDLGFAVAVQDSGDSQEVQIKVTLTIQQQPTPIMKTQTIDLINAGEQKTVVFRNLGQVQFATKTVVKVDVQPVPGETNTTNNSAQYAVIFSLG